MRRYLIQYYAERNDECVDLETIVEADTIAEALLIFDKQYKRITAINEIRR